jgi:predicted signal transduction protein with EAL and GGDEF domain
MPDNPQPEIRTPQSRRLARQKRIVMAASCLLIVGGFIVFFAVKRLPLPMRFMVAMTDIVGGMVLIILANRKE